MIETLPQFSRVEITMENIQDILHAASVLKELASDLEFIAGKHKKDDALILAHHKIRTASKKVRKND